jgi:hypothetical protein
VSKARTVEALPDERAGGDDEQRFIRVRVFQLGEGGGSLLCPHAAAQRDGIVAACGELHGQPFEVAGPLREHKAVPSALAGVDDVLDDVLKPLVVSDEVAVYGRHASRRLWARVAVVGLAGGMHQQYRVRDRSIDGGEGVSGSPRDRVPDRPDLEGDEVVELITAVRRRGQAEPTSSGDLGNSVREGGCRYVMALIDLCGHPHRSTTSVACQSSSSRRRAMAVSLARRPDGAGRARAWPCPPRAASSRARGRRTTR